MSKPEDLGFDSERLERVGDVCRRHVDEGKFAGTSVLVAREGQVVYRDVYGWADVAQERKLADDTIFRIFSMTKPLASMALMQLVEQGKVLLHNEVSRFIPSFKESRVYVSGDENGLETAEPEREITVHDILTHMSGIGSALQRGPVGRIHRRHGLDFGKRPKMSLEEYTDLLASLPLEFHPGSRWLYSSATDVVGRVVEVVSGQRLGDYMARNIFEPVGMTDTAFWVPPEKADRFCTNYTRQAGELTELDTFERSRYRKPPELDSGAGGLVGTVDDYHRFLSCLGRGGELNGARIIGRKTLEYMTMNHIPGGVDLQTYGYGTAETALPGIGFGLGFGVTIDPAQTRQLTSFGEYTWGGAASTTFWVDPAEDVHVIFMTQFFPSGTYAIRPQLRWTVNQALT